MLQVAPVELGQDSDGGADERSATEFCTSDGSSSAGGNGLEPLGQPGHSDFDVDAFFSSSVRCSGCLQEPVVDGRRTLI